MTNLERGLRQFGCNGVTWSALCVACAVVGNAHAADISEPYLELEQLEIQIGRGEEAAQWDFVTGIETPVIALSLQSEGDIETQTGRVDSAEAEFRLSRRLSPETFAFGGGRFAKIEGRNVTQAVAGIGGQFGDAVYDLSVRLFEATAINAEVLWEFPISDNMILEPGFEVELPINEDGVRDRSSLEPEFELIVGLITQSDFGVFANEISFMQDASERTVFFATEYSGFQAGDVDIIPEFDLELTFPRSKAGLGPTRSYEATIKVAAGFEGSAIQPYIGMIYERDHRSSANEARTGLNDSDRVLFLVGARAEY